MMTTSTRTRSLSLGFRYRCLLTFAVLLPALLSGVSRRTGHAPIFDWEELVEGGTVQVSKTQLRSDPDSGRDRELR